MLKSFSLFNRGCEQDNGSNEIYQTRARLYFYLTLWNKI